MQLLNRLELTNSFRVTVIASGTMAGMLEPDYSSVEAKLNRANEHFAIVHSKVKAWVDGGTNTFTIERGSYDTRVGLAVNFFSGLSSLLIALTICVAPSTTWSLQLRNTKRLQS